MLAAVAWCGSLAMIGLPFYVSHLPGGSAKLWLFDLESGAVCWAAFAAGVVGLLLVAPWATVGLAAVHGRRWPEASSRPAVHASSRPR